MKFGSVVRIWTYFLKRCDRISLMKMAKMTGRTEAKIFSELMAIVLRMTRSTSARCVGLPNIDLNHSRPTKSDTASGMPGRKL